ncbi:hypothetical protein [Marinifilum caeruleilacunae]|jgi:hypothetical protein|uniref:Uncharacterized protein n=1 Tax=Marinifilum caeruleilacunae TaxID=2499076 RepID=A0ABX1WTI1_9BACT|nr:hypothetical protein [Marinifilum caeruleilacunae]NOU59410.1 hypothetical protein [Marinifilum caeruleilacunae]
MKDRDSLYNEAVKSLDNPSKNNVHIIKTHLFRLKVNNEYVINTKEQLDDLVTFINCNHGK